MEFLAETIESVSVVLERYENDLFTLLCKPNTYKVNIMGHFILSMGQAGIGDSSAALIQRTIVFVKGTSYKWTQYHANKVNYFIGTIGDVH